jgi:hypothetical protein
MRKQPQSFEISIEFEGKNYTARYYVASNVVTVHSAFGTNSTHVGASAKFTAQILFREILQGAKSRGEL